jgi:hypothetical protein
MSGNKMRECLSRRALLSGTAAGAKAIAVDDPAEPDDAGEESDALANRDQAAIRVGRQGRSTLRSNGAWPYPGPICSTRRLKACPCYCAA